MQLLIQVAKKCRRKYNAQVVNRTFAHNIAGFTVLHLLSETIWLTRNILKPLTKNSSKRQRLSSRRGKSKKYSYCMVKACDRQMAGVRTVQSDGANYLTVKNRILALITNARRRAVKQPFNQSIKPHGSVLRLARGSLR